MDINDLRVFEIRGLIEVDSKNRMLDLLFINPFIFSIFQGNPSLIFRVLSERFKKFENSQRIQCAFFCPPLQIQDPSNGKFTTEQFITFCRILFLQIHNMLKNEGFLIFHTFEPNYAKVKIVLDEIFGRQNHISTFIWKKHEESNLFSEMYDKGGIYYQSEFDYILLYCKDIERKKFYKLPPKDKLYKNPDNDPRGPWESRPLIQSAKSSNVEYTYTFKNGLTLTRKFRFTRENLEKFEKEDRIHFTKPKKGQGIPRLKVFFYERLDKYKKTGKGGTIPNSLWTDTTQYGSLESLMKDLEDHPKLELNKPYRPKKLYKSLMQMTTLEGDLILDCFCQLGVVLQAANELKRNWLGAEMNYTNISEGIIPWLKSKINDKKSKGIEIRVFKLADSIFNKKELNSKLSLDNIARGIFENFQFDYKGETSFTFVNPNKEVKTNKKKFRIFLGKNNGKFGIVLLKFPPEIHSGIYIRKLINFIKNRYSRKGEKFIVFTNCGFNLLQEEIDDLKLFKIPYVLLKKYKIQKR